MTEWVLIIVFYYNSRIATVTIPGFKTFNQCMDSGNKVKIELIDTKWKWDTEQIKYACVEK